MDLEKLKTIKTIKNSDVKEFSLNGKEFIGKVVDVYDGDTCKIVFYLKDEIVKFNCRLFGINAPELKPLKTKENRLEEIENGKKAKHQLISFCCNRESVDDKNCLIKIKCFEWDKYGRLLVELYDLDKEESINNKLIESG